MSGLVSQECPVCLRLYSEVDPTTLPCGHTLCIEDAKKLKKCPICDEVVLDGFKFPVNFTIRHLVAPVQPNAVSEALHLDSTTMVSQELIHPDLLCDLLNDNTPTPAVEDQAVPDLHSQIVADTGANDNDDSESDNEASNSAVVVVVSSGKKKKKRNKKKKSSVEKLTIAFEQATYYLNEEAFQTMLTAAKAGNVYAVGYLELYHLEIHCFNQYFDRSAVVQCMESLFTLGNQNDPMAMFIIAMHVRHRPANGWMGISDYSGYIKAFEFLNRCVELGFTLALSELADCYFNGRGVDKDIQKGIDMHNRAIFMGHYHSGCGLQYDLGDEKHLVIAAAHGVVMAQQAQGLSDLQHGKGDELIRSSAERGFPSSMMYVSLSETGEVALEWLKKAARKGYEDAVKKLMDLITSEELELHKLPDYFYELAAKMKLEDAVVMWAGALRRLKRDEEAFAVLKQYADKDNDPFLLHLTAGCYEMKQDWNEARRYHEMAVELDYVDSMFSLGGFYEDGNGVEVDLDKALTYYYRAHNSGDKDASRSIRRVIEAKLKLRLRSI